MNPGQYTIRPIGVIHSPYTSTAEAPRQGSDERVTIEVHSDFIEGLRDLEGFSHLHIFYWLHHSKGFHLLVQPPWETGKHGLFATRSPHRPNPLGHSVVKLLSIKNNMITVEGLDAIEGTPVVDIKPYITTLDAISDARNGWATDRLKPK